MFLLPQQESFACSLQCGRLVYFLAPVPMQAYTMPSYSSRSEVRLPRFTFLVLLLIGLMPLAVGCGSGDKTGKDSPAEADATSAAREALEKSRLCAENFDKIYQVLRPKPENADTELQSAQDILNQWLMSCAEWTDYKIDPNNPLFAREFDAAVIESLNQHSASQLDVLYVRDQLLLRATVEHEARNLPTDADKARSLFHYVCRNITRDDRLINRLLLVPQLVDEETLKLASPETIPRSLQDVSLAGRGTTNDRIWLLAGLLHQLNMPTLLVETEGDAAAEFRQLVLVPLDQEVLVFSPGLGLEFRPAEGNWKQAQLKEDFSQVFNILAETEQADQDLLAPLKSADWSKAKTFLPYNILVASPRMQILQFEAVGDYACELFEPAAAIDGEESTEDQYEALFGEIFADFEPAYWPYPRAMYERVVNSDATGDRLRSLYMATLFKEVQSLRSSENQNEERVFTSSLEKRMLMARVDQLTGQLSSAISTFVKLRLQQGVAGEGDIVALENLMRYLQAEDALYWSGVAQFENGDFRTAGNTLKNYLDRYTEGRWVQPARELLAESLAEQDRMDEAKAALKLDQWTGPARLRQLKRLETWQQ